MSVCSADVFCCCGCRVEAEATTCPSRPRSVSCTSEANQPTHLHQSTSLRSALPQVRAPEFEISALKSFKLFQLFNESLHQNFNTLLWKLLKEEVVLKLPECFAFLTENWYSMVILTVWLAVSASAWIECLHGILARTPCSQLDYILLNENGSRYFRWFTFRPPAEILSNEEFSCWIRNNSFFYSVRRILTCLYISGGTLYNVL